MRGYDAWLEAPYQRAAALDAEAERIVERFGIELLEACEDCGDEVEIVAEDMRSDRYGWEATVTAYCLSGCGKVDSKTVGDEADFEAMGY